jgi:hypothetical protein
MGRQARQLSSSGFQYTLPITMAGKLSQLGKVLTIWLTCTYPVSGRDDRLGRLY